MPETNPEKKHRFLVVGNAVPETVNREDGATRTHIGGVGAIMARELARAGAEVTLLCPVEESQVRDLTATLEAYGVNPMPVIQKSRTNPGVRINIRRGEPVKINGVFPKPTSVLSRLKAVSSEYPTAVTGLYVNMSDLDHLSASHPRVIANATTNRLAPRLLRMKGVYAMTMNHTEARALMREEKTQEGQILAQRMQAEYLLITSGPVGRTLYQRGAVPDRRPPVTAPQGADFIGAGDSLTAGLAYALANDLNVQDTMDRFLEQLLKFNAESYH